MFALKFRKDEIIDRITHPGRVLDRRNCGTLGSLEGPMVPATRLLGDALLRPHGVLLHPVAKNSDLLVLEFCAADRHFEFAGLLNRLDQETFGRRTWLN